MKCTYNATGYSCQRNAEVNNDLCFLHNRSIKLDDKIQQALKENNKKGNSSFVNADLVGAEFNGAHIKRYDFTNAKLQYAKFNNATLSSSIFNKANLFFAEFNNTKLNGTSFEKANIVGTQFLNADLSFARLEGAEIIGADLRNANLQNAFLWNVKLDNVYFQNTFLLDTLWDLNERNYLGDSDANYIIRNKRICQYSAAYLMNYYRENGCFQLSEKFYLVMMSSLNMQRNRYEKEYHYYLRKFIMNIWGVTSKYGTSILRWFLTSLVLIIFFGIIYSYNAWWFDTGKVLNKINIWKSWFSPFYFSTVTFTTLGFGDIKPIELQGEIIVTIEVFIGYIMLGGLISIFAKRFIKT